MQWTIALLKHDGVTNSPGIWGILYNIIHFVPLLKNLYCVDFSSCAKVLFENQGLFHLFTVNFKINSSWCVQDLNTNRKKVHIMTQTEVQLTSTHLACELEGGKNNQKNMHVHTQKGNLANVVPTRNNICWTTTLCTDMLQDNASLFWYYTMTDRPQTKAAKYRRCNIIDTEAITLWASITLQLT